MCVCVCMYVYTRTRIHIHTQPTYITFIGKSPCTMILVCFEVHILTCMCGTHIHSNAQHSNQAIEQDERYAVDHQVPQVLGSHARIRHLQCAHVCVCKHMYVNILLCIHVYEFIYLRTCMLTYSSSLIQAQICRCNLLCSWKHAREQEQFSAHVNTTPEWEKLFLTPTFWSVQHKKRFSMRSSGIKWLLRACKLCHIHTHAYTCTWNYHRCPHHIAVCVCVCVCVCEGYCAWCTCMHVTCIHLELLCTCTTSFCMFDAAFSRPRSRPDFPGSPSFTCSTSRGSKSWYKVNHRYIHTYTDVYPGTYAYSKPPASLLHSHRQPWCDVGPYMYMYIDAVHKSWLYCTYMYALKRWNGSMYLNEKRF
jgi:hypothetical protein